MSPKNKIEKLPSGIIIQNGKQTGVYLRVGSVQVGCTLITIEAARTILAKYDELIEQAPTHTIMVQDEMDKEVSIKMGL